MKRRDFLRTAMMGSAVTLAGYPLYGGEGKSERPFDFARGRPNIIFLLADDQCSYSMGCYGNKDVKTPILDKLADDGMVFDRHYDTTAICMASRANVMTGMYEYKTGCNFSHGDLSTENFELTYPVLLRKAGYMTAFAGKFGFEVEGIGYPEDRFDIWGGGPGQTSYDTARNKSMVKYAEKYPHSTLSYGAFGQDVIKEAKKQNKSFCLSISFKAPHKPATPDPKFDDVYEGKTFKKPANFGREHGKHLSEQSKQGRQWARFESWDYDKDYDGVMQKYYQQIYGIDVAVGMMREELARQGLADNTVIIYTSDNGFLCGSHGYGSKVLPFEESTSVPLIVYDPRHSSSGKKQRSKSVTGNIDFAPTILGLAGLPVPEQMDGKSLLPLLNDPAKKIRDNLAIMNVWSSSGEAIKYLGVVSGKWKYTYWWYAGEGMKPAEELFDIENDKLELKNLAVDSKYADILDMMRKKYDHELELWKKRAVPYNDYQRYGVLYDRSIQWDQKTGSLDKPKKVKNSKKKGK